jgi:hypothetical protein
MLLKWKQEYFLVLNWSEAASFSEPQLPPKVASPNMPYSPSSKTKSSQHFAFPIQMDLLSDFIP